ncbi:MAG: hypothetical protein H6Q15_639 [Bacteroidetes bacterium]|nr:hypothetical protein [Bacteroidota bacterium]
MKTKNLFFLILLLGLSFNAISQEEVTIKQVLKNSNTSSEKNNRWIRDEINEVIINTSLPVTIKGGIENAIFLTGEFNNSEDYAGFCILEDGALKINSPKKGKSITLELGSDVQAFYIINNANVVFYKDIIIRNEGEIIVENNSSATFKGFVTGNKLYVKTKNNSKINFFTVYLDILDLQLANNSEVKLKGKTNILKVDKDESSKVIEDDFTYINLNKSCVTKGEDISISDTTAEKEYNKLSNVWNPKNANVFIGKNSKVRIIFSDNMNEDYISNYPIKGYEKGKLVIQDDYPLDLVITIKKDIGNITIEEGAKVIIESEIKEDNRSYYLHNNSELIFNKNVEVKELGINLNNASKVSFKHLKTDNLFIQGNGSSELEINGEIGLLDRYKYDDINLKGDYKINSTRKRMIKELGISAPIPLNINSKNRNGNENSEKIKAQNLGKDKVNIDLAFSYGVLNWSNGVNKVDDLFSSPNNEYKLRLGDSWNIGLKFRYNFNPKLRLFAGIGFESNVFRFENNVKMTETNGDKRLAYETDPSILNSKSNINARYVTIPIHFQYFFYKKFSIHAGGVLGINYRNSSTGFEREYDITNAKISEEWGKNYDNFKPIKLEVQAGLGWSSYNFYLKYSLTPLFKDNKEIEVLPYSIGFSLGI